MKNDEYRRVAALYDRLFSATLRRLREDIRTYIYHKDYRKIIDICCGTAQQLRLLDRPGMSLVGLDNSISMLQQASKVMSERIELHLLDAEQQSFAAGSFDCAIISLALHEKHPAVRHNIYAGAKTLVRQGGDLIIAEYGQVPSALRGFMLGKLVIPLIERCAGRDHHAHYRSWMQEGALEGFLEHRQTVSDIISRPLAGTLLCCAVRNDEAIRTDNLHFGLLDKALDATTPALT